MIVETGHFALILALCVALIQCSVPLVGLRQRKLPLLAVADACALPLLALIAISFGTLIWAHVSSDFSVANVVLNSNSTKPLIYKVSGVWGNHEGSMVLWVLILALFGAAVSVFGRSLPLDLRSTVLAIQGLISATFLAFIVATSNPFTRIFPPPADGQGLNPILQDPALAIHPPLLYTGYVGFSIAFSFAVAALLLGRLDQAWARWVRPWTLAAWIFLTVGIAVGSWWAYYELGWGGFWFWDSVENASLMPWLTGTALIHSAIVMEKRDSLKAWTVLLAILTFSLSLLGTFLVRSGVLTSVHSFASDPQRGVVILMILAGFTGGSLALFAWRARAFTGGAAFAFVSREGSLVLNNLLLVVTCGIVLVGTLYPLALEAVTGDKISVGAPFFNATAVWVYLGLLVAIPFGLFLTWKRGGLTEAWSRLRVSAALAGAVAIAVLVAGSGFKHALTFGLGAWVIFGAIAELLVRAKASSSSLSETWQRFKAMKRAQYGAALGHIGLGVSVIGVAAATAFNAETLAVMKVGDTIEVGGYRIAFRGLDPVDGPNYTEQSGRFDVLSGDTVIASVAASKRKYETPPTTTTEAGIAPRLLGDVYVVLGSETAPGQYAVRAYMHPMVRWIWAGAVIMFIGGAVSLLDRRLRLGLPERAARTKLAPAE
jgi:cytochrome c-type biogenesis protein CcmF